MLARLREDVDRVAGCSASDPTRQPMKGYRKFATASDAKATNGEYLNYAMLYHDCVAFLLFNDLGVAPWIASRGGSGVTPKDVAAEFKLSERAASALLVTLCRMNVVAVLKDSDDSVDEIEYGLTPSAQIFLSDRSAAAVTSPFIDTFRTNFITPEKLLEASAPVEKQDLMSQHLQEADPEVANNARHFMKHMNAQSYSCAEALPSALGLGAAREPMTLLDVGGGSAIYTIEAVWSNPKMTGIVFELPAIKPITEEFVAEAGLRERISVHAGDFFTDEPFPAPVDIVLFSNILHDWPDEVNMKLLQKAFDCLNPGGRVVISELLLADDVRSSTSSATSMNIIMIPYTKGRQYRAKELLRRLSKVGFVGSRVEPLVDDYSLVIARRAE